MSSASSMAFLMESTAASRFTTTPRRMPRDSATPMPTMSRPFPSRISPTTADTFEVPTSSPTRYRSFRANSTPPRQTRRPAQPSYFCLLTSAFLLLPSYFRLLTSLGRPHVDAIVEPQIHVVDVSHALA